jgi:translocation and assembly module TamB
MNEVAMMLGVTGGETLGKQLGEQVGLDEVSISSEPGGTTTQASLLMGKYLTPELFVSYGIGIFEPVSTLRLLYTLSSHWKLVGEASELGSAADIFYVVERGE